MMRKILGILMALLFCLSAAACVGGNRESGNDKADAEMTMSRYGGFTYRDAFFFEYSPSLTELTENKAHTLKYLNLASENEKGVEVYGGEGKDIFESGFALSMIDEESTEKNGGVPVLIVAVPLDTGVEDALSLEVRHRLVSYDMATGKAKILVEDTEYITRLAIYRDKIYYIQFRVRDAVEDAAGNWNVSANYVLSSIPREGGTPERVYTAKGDSLSFVGSCQGKLYLNLTDTQKLVCCDPNG